MKTRAVFSNRNTKPKTPKASVANQLPTAQRFFGMHFEPGLAEYQDAPDQDAYRILVSQDLINAMNPSFEGKPFFVNHVDDINEREPDGYVVKSFFNTPDGRTWAEFMCCTEEGLKAIKQGWVLSNAYVPSEFGKPGIWHGMDYEKEVMRAEFEHLALVDNPRYEGSVIMTPEEFAQYNEQKKSELAKIANSKTKKEPSMFTWTKRDKVENDLAEKIESSVVTLPKSKVEKSVKEMVSLADSFVVLNGYADGDMKVKCGDDEMTVNEMVGKFVEMKEAAQKNADDEASAAAKKDKKNKKGEPGGEEEDEVENSDPEESAEDIAEGEVGGGDEIDNDDEEMENGDDEDFDNDESEEEELEEAEDAKKPKKKAPNASHKPKQKNGGKRRTNSNFDRLDSAADRSRGRMDRPIAEIGMDEVERGRQLYGSGK
jgi:hypothetical protein